MNTLSTDLYQFTMAYGYWKSGMAEHEAVFHVIYRRNPFKSGYAIAAGLANVIEYIEQFKLEPSDVDYLSQYFPKDFLDYLKNMKLTVDVEAVEEGTVVFPQEPLVRVKGPLIQCQLLETAILNSINFATLVATKASRICYAAKGEPVIEFGLRRAQGPDGGLTASRSAYIGGCVGTSNVLAGKKYGIPIRGTHAHSWVTAFATEDEAFEKFASTMPDNCYLLVDTFDSLAGVKKAIKIGKKLLGIRLDSGDLAYLSIKARKILDKAGLKNAHIMASNDLDEYIIESLKEQKAKIDIWAVGTKLATAYDQPALDGIYKLSAIRPKGGKWEYKLKLSEQNAKISTPGMLRVKRFYNKKSGAMADCIYDELTGLPDSALMIDMLDSTRRKKIPKGTKGEELLKNIFKKGKCVYSVPEITASRERTFKQLKLFHSAIRRFLNPHVYPVGLEKNLFELRMNLILKMKQNV
ncbi:MAG: nicotinate phosphoribosyltransferase [Gammaproteobacteria bacterium]|nr:nicotinate phosphoribosyltransferase [Gammaproteobacteria bacterium]